MRCNFVGIGVQKSASTWVYRILQDHDEVKVSNPKELDFFSQNYSKGIKWYDDHFLMNSNPASAKVYGEISPSYFNDIDAPKNAYEYNPNFKIIVTLRDPVERVYSNHLHRIRIDDYDADDLTLESGLKYYSEYLEQSFYYKHISNWLTFFPRNQVLILLQEDIKNDPEKAALQVYKFLEIDQGHKSAFLYRKANVSFTEKVKGVDTTLKMVSKAFRKLGLARIVDTIKSSDIVLDFREKNRHHLGSVVPEMKDETMTMLHDTFSDDVLKLSILLGVKSLPWDTWVYANTKVSHEST
jgi:hypothetical protein